eukprot:1581211-Pyramimonas_sp.AAC.1
MVLLWLARDSVCQADMRAEYEPSPSHGPTLALVENKDCPRIDSITPRLAVEALARATGVLHVTRKRANAKTNVA